MSEVKLKVRDKEKFRTVAAVYMVLVKNGLLLLAKRANTGYADGKYALVAGHVEAGESIKQAMVREVYEEAGLRIAEEDLRLLLTMHRYSPSSDPPERLDFFLTADSFLGEPENMEPHKCEEMGWFPLDQLPENLVAYLRFGLDQIARGENYCEYGFGQ